MNSANVLAIIAGLPIGDSLSKPVQKVKNCDRETELLRWKVNQW